MTTTETPPLNVTRPIAGAALHPTKVLVPLAEAMAWGNGGGGPEGFIYQEKMDGEFSERAVHGGILAGENIIRKNLAPSWFAFDCLQYHGFDVRSYPLIKRLRLRDRLCEFNNIKIVPETSGQGGAFLKSILARGGEGICRKRLAANYWEAMTVAKRGEIWLCRVAAIAGGSQSVEIEIIQGAENLNFAQAKEFFILHSSFCLRAAGRLPLRGGKIDKIRVGSLIRVEGMGLTAAGKIRQPNPAREWLVRY